MYVMTRSEAPKAALKTKPVAKAAGWHSTKAPNREEWLTRVCQREIVPLLTQCGGAAPGRYRVSVGWPKNSRGGKTVEAIGQCWDKIHSSDDTFEVFVAPTQGAFEAIAVLIHELVHLSVGIDKGHKSPFKKLAVAVGLEGKMTATVAGSELAKKIRAWLADMPPFPHGPMKPAEGSAKEKKPGSRLLKAVCEGCGYTVRVTQQWLDIAPPLCPDPECDNYQQSFLTD